MALPSTSLPKFFILNKIWFFRIWLFQRFYKYFGVYLGEKCAFPSSLDLNEWFFWLVFWFFCFLNHFLKCPSPRLSGRSRGSSLIGEEKVGKIGLIDSFEKDKKSSKSSWRNRSEDQLGPIRSRKGHLKAQHAHWQPVHPKSSQKLEKLIQLLPITQKANSWYSNMSHFTQLIRYKI